jgi:hypothetical protein
VKRKRCPECSEFMNLAKTSRNRVYTCACGKVIRVPLEQSEEDEPEAEPDVAPSVRKQPRRKSIKRRAEGGVLIDYWNYYNDSFGSASYVVLGLGLFWLCGLMGTCALPPAALVLIGVGIVAYYGGYIWLIVIGFSDSSLAGFLLLAGAFIPFIGLLGLIYAVMNIGETWRALVIMLMGFLIIFSAALAAALSPMHLLLHR